MDDLKLYIVSYNVATRSPDGNVADLLGLKCDSEHQRFILPDFYLIGLQEVKAQPQNYLLDTLFDDPWSNAFRKALIPFGYIKVKTVRLIGIVLSVFCLRKHLTSLRDMQTLCTRTGLMGLWGNKGGVTMRLQIGGCSLCFVNCHLAPHDHLLKERITDYNTILQDQKFNADEASNILFHDYVFWFGDLNFRLSHPLKLTSSEIEKCVNHGSLPRLLADDQLKNVMSSGEAFSELTEEELKFPPTYKYQFLSKHYDLSRRPAWTDRILYKVNANNYENVTLEAAQTSYKSIDNYSVSDHRPVIGTFTIKVFSNHVDRVVKFLPITNWYTNEENMATCLLGSDVEANQWDWVGVYAESFTSLDDYYGFVYINSCDIVNPSQDLSQAEAKIRDKIEIKFPETMMRNAGRYRLLYFTRDSGSLLGMSSEFLVQERVQSLNMRMRLYTHNPVSGGWV